MIFSLAFINTLDGNGFKWIKIFVYLLEFSYHFLEIVSKKQIKLLSVEIIFYRLIFHDPWNWSEPINDSFKFPNFMYFGTFSITNTSLNETSALNYIGQNVEEGHYGHTSIAFAEYFADIKCLIVFGIKFTGATSK